MSRLKYSYRAKYSHDLCNDLCNAAVYLKQRESISLYLFGDVQVISLGRSNKVGEQEEKATVCYVEIENEVTEALQQLGGTWWWCGEGTYN